MDFSGGIVEQIEQTFGKPAAKLLLALIYLAIAATCVHIIYPSILKVFYHIENYIMSQFPGLISNNKSDQIGAVVSGFLTALCYILLAIFFIKINRSITHIGSKAE
ncbi:MAG: hypothetical protein B7Y67_18180, partial [Polynucleobacter sp. 35-46-11]|uniref:hypothetical protein n=1 Tax=Polynucleobacter sp. 35-46-11 TaxID=1970425 RepID=UPI000BC48249